MTDCIIYIMGVSGSGKTTIGKLLSTKTGLQFFDADDLHPDANKEKMKAGIPLNDDDRKLWLQKINELAIEQSKLNGAIIACSALKEKYRIILASGLPDLIWIFLHGSYEIILERMQKRKDHYMPVQLLQSQFDSLEIPAYALAVDIKKNPETQVDMILKFLSYSPQH